MYELYMLIYNISIYICVCAYTYITRSYTHTYYVLNSWVLISTPYLGLTGDSSSNLHRTIYMAIISRRTILEFY